MKLQKLRFSTTLLAAMAMISLGIARPVTPRAIDIELGSMLGFQAYRYEVQLAEDEALVVHELVTVGSRRMDAEYAVVGNGKATYELVLLDSGFFHPTLKNTYMLRFPTSNGPVNDVVLTRSSQGPEGIEFIFSDPTTYQVKITRRWSASVEKHDEVRRRWPELPFPQSGVLSSSRRLIADSAPDPADPAAATPAFVSTRTVVPAKGDLATASTTRIVPVESVSIEQLRADAANDNAAAQVALGVAYYTGNGVVKDVTQAAEWFRKAAELGDVGAQHNLGAMYANGSGVAKDWESARSWYLKAAAQGDLRSMSNLAANYANGRGGPVDLVQAFFWAKKAGDQGFAPSESDLGTMYEAGLGVSKDLAQAIVWYRRAANQGDARAQAALSRLGVTWSNLR